MNSTIIRKKKKCKTCNRLEYIFSHGECKGCATIKSTQKRQQKYEQETEDESLQNLISDLDAVFSLYIRHKYANDKGIVKCFTCPKELHVSQIQNGHYTSRSHYGLRFLENNAKPQCPSCNSNHETNIEPFKTALEKEQPGITEWLEEQARQVYKPTRDEIKQLLAEYRFKLSLVKKK